MARRPRKPEREGSLSSLANVLPGLCQELDWDRKVNEFAFLRLWPSQITELLGAEIAFQTKAVKLRKQGARVILMIKVSSAALASELGFHAVTLKDALNRFEPQTSIKIHQIQFSVGSLT